jgi:hypothetical protein
MEVANESGMNKNVSAVVKLSTANC